MRRRQYAPKPAQDASVLSSAKLLQTRPFQPEIDNNLQAPSIQSPVQPMTGGWDLTQMEFVDEPPRTETISPLLQTKLAVGAPNDKYEQEADRTAKQVVQRLSLGGGESLQSNQPLQRNTLSNAKDKLQMKPLLQRQEEGAVDASDNLESAIQQSRGGGQPLADSIRGSMEQAFGGVDFGGVKVHTDGRSDQLNRSIQAKAFTTGQDVFFRRGAYAPGSRGGQELIAHELTHVVQQNGAGKESLIQCFYLENKDQTGHTWIPNDKWDPHKYEVSPNSTLKNGWVVHSLFREIPLYERFQRLHALEKKLLQASKNEAVEKVESKLDEINTQRQKLIAELIEENGELWLPETIEAADRRKAQALWSSISSNAGNIQIDQTDADFRLKVLSDIAKLLQSSHARTMLDELNADQEGEARSRTIDIVPNKATDNAPKSIVSDGKKGVGSTTSMNYSESHSSAMGLEDEEIHNPTYIKLGHELGHASHYLKGTSGSGNAAEAGKDPLEEVLWTSQEEYNNITLEENPMRADLGLAPRKYHKTYEQVLRKRRIMPVVQSLTERYNQINDPKAERPVPKQWYRNPPPELIEAEEWLNPDGQKWGGYELAHLDTAIDVARKAMDDFARIVQEQQ